jgi:dihydroxyacetone kinase
MFCAVTVWAESIDWLRAENGVPYEQSIAFSGCSPAGGLADQKAYKIALLRAQANVARAKQATISGEEHITAGQHGSAGYKIKIFETSSAFLGQLDVLVQEIIEIDNMRQLCLLVIECR